MTLLPLLDPISAFEVKMLSRKARVITSKDKKRLVAFKTLHSKSSICHFNHLSCRSILLHLCVLLGQPLTPPGLLLESFYIMIVPLFYFSSFKNISKNKSVVKSGKVEKFKFCVCEWIKEGGGGGWYFLIPYTAPTDRIIFYDCVEQYPFVAKGSYDSFYLTPPLLNKVGWAGTGSRRWWRRV